MKANDGLFATFAFGMNDIMQGVYQHSTAALRYAVMEKKTRPMKVGPQRTAEEDKIDALRRLKEKRFAIGSKLTSSKFDRWLSERDSGLNTSPSHLSTGDWWRGHFGDTARSRQRQFFTG